MAQWQGRSRKKPTGGIRIYARKKRKYEIGREVLLPTVGEEDRVEAVRTRGGNRKRSLHRVGVANVTDPGTGTTRQVDVETVVDNPANPHYIRRNIVTKGAVIQTELGRARVTSRPGQHGVVNAVLLEPGEVVEPTPMPEEDEEPEEAKAPDEEAEEERAEAGEGEQAEQAEDAAAPSEAEDDAAADEEKPVADEADADAETDATPADDDEIDEDAPDA